MKIPKKAHKYTDDLESLYGKYEPGTNKSYAQGYELWPEFDVIFPGGINFEEELSKEECIDYFIKVFPSCSKGRALKVYTYNYPEDITCAEATVMEALKGVGQYYYVSDSGEAHLNAYMKRSGHLTVPVLFPAFSTERHIMGSYRMVIMAIPRL